MNDVVKKRSRWWIWALASVFLLLVAAWFVISSSMFVRSVVLPRVAAAVGCEISVEDISLSPLSQITLRKLRVTPHGAETLLAAESVRVQYDGLGFLRGTVRIREVTLESPVVTLVEGVDGKSNLDRVLTSLNSGSAPPKAGASAPPKIDLANISIRNGTLRSTRPVGLAGVRVVEVSNLNLGLDHLKNGGSGRLTLDANGRFLQPVDDSLETRLAGGAEITVGDDFQPRIVNGSFSNRITTAKGAFKSFAGLEAVVVSDLTPTEVRSLGVSFRQNDQDLGKFRISGPLDLAKKSGSLTYDVSGIDRRVLGLLGATAGGLDLGRTTLSANGTATLSAGGTVVASEGKLRVGNFGVSSTNGVTPMVDLDLAYQTAVNLDESTAILNKLDISGTQGNRALVRASLDRAMSLAWGKGGSGFRESTFTLELLSLALAEWRPLLGPDAPSGDIDAKVVVRAEKEGRLLKFKLGGEGRNLTARVAGSRLENGLLKYSAEGSVENFKGITLDKFSGALQQAGQPLAALEGHLDLNPDTQAANVQFSGTANLPAVTGLFPIPGFTARAGELKFTGQMAGKLTGTNLTANVNLARYSGKYGDLVFEEFPANLVLAADIVNSELRISRATITAGQGGAMDLTGSYSLDHRKGRMVVKTRNLNQTALSPFLAAALRPKTLQSISLDVDLTADFDAAGESQLTGDVQVKNLVVLDNGRPISPPAQLSLTVDGGMKGSLVEIRKCLLAVEPTPRAKNQLTATARIDLGTNHPAPSTFSLQSDGIDLTTLYDLFARNPTNKVANPSPVTASTPAPGRPEAEPAPILLPIQKLDGDIRIARLYLHDVAISDWTQKISIDRGVVRMDPVALNLNGAPINSRVKLDLGVPGYVYDVDFNADRVPIAPLNDLYDPASSGRLAGTFTVKSHIQGSGVTGVNLQKNLTGQFDLSATNLNLAIAQVKSPVLKTLVTVISGIPSAIKNPTAALGNLLNQFTGASQPGTSQSSWADELSKSPIDALLATATAGAGQVKIQRATVQSRAFIADAAGAVTLATQLTNSTILAPVTVSLRRPLAESAGLVPADSPTNATYVKLPDFLSLKGTVGVPKPDLNYLVLANMALKATGVAGGQSGKSTAEKGANLIQGLGNLLNGTPAPTPQGAPVAAPRTATPQAVPATPAVQSAPKSPLIGPPTNPAPAPERTLPGDALRSLIKGSQTNAPPVKK